MTELRLILIIVGVLLVLGIYYWGRRSTKPEAHQEYVRGEDDWLEKLAEQRKEREPREEDIPYTSDAIRFETNTAAAEPPLGDLDLESEPSEAIRDRNRKTGAMSEPALFADEDDAPPAPMEQRREAVDERSAPRSAPSRQAPAETKTGTKPEDDFILDETPRKTTERKSAARPVDGDELILAMFVMSHPGQQFNGSELLSAMTEAGLRYGDMNIFHMHQHPDGSGPVLFSVANMMEPGTFDMQTMGDFQSPGLAMFMRLPGAVDGERALDKMVATGRLLAQQLDGDLKDETRSTLTQQTVGHLRERITAFQLKQLAKKK